MKIFLITFFDSIRNDIFSIRFQTKSAQAAREYFLRKYQSCVLILVEDINKVPESFDFED